MLHHHQPHGGGQAIRSFRSLGVGFKPAPKERNHYYPLLLRAYRPTGFRALPFTLYMGKQRANRTSAIYGWDTFMYFDLGEVIDW